MKATIETTEYSRDYFSRGFTPKVYGMEITIHAKTEEQACDLLDKLIDALKEYCPLSPVYHIEEEEADQGFVISELIYSLREHYASQEHFEKTVKAAFKRAKKALKIK